MARLTLIEGIGESYAAKLEAVGIRSTATLLGVGCSAEGRKKIAATSGIGEKLILTWVNHADLFRIKGVSGEYAELLEAAGVDSVPELAPRNNETLFEKITAVNKEKKLVRRPPTRTQVIDWIEQAGKLPRLVTH